MLFEAFKKCLKPGEMTLGWDEMKSMQDQFAPMQDQSVGGHWCWDLTTAKAAFEFATHIFGEGGRISFP